MNTPVTEEIQVDLARLQAQWSPEGRYFTPGRGEFEINGKTYEYRVRVIKVVNPEHHFPTDNRVVVDMAPDLDKAADYTRLRFPGWGETVAQSGDQIALTLQEANKKGWENPWVVTAHTGGKGTPEYMEAENLAQITLNDVQTDARAITSQLLADGTIRGNVTLEGHSMGAPLTYLAAEVLLSQWSQHADYYRLVNIENTMAVTDQPLAWLRPWLWRARKQIPTAMAETVTRRGSLHLPPADYNNMMLSETGNSEETPEHQGGVNDSGTYFLQRVLATNRSTLTVLPQLSERGVFVYMVEAENDHIIPDSMTDGWLKILRRNQVEAYPLMADGFPHTPPFDMTVEQESTWRRILRQTIPQADIYPLSSYARKLSDE